MATKEQLPSGKWRVSWREGGGRKGPKQSATFAREAEAVVFRGLVDAAGQRWPEQYRQPEVRDELTFAEWAERWVASRQVRTRTAADYRRILARDVNPHLGPLPLASISSEQVGLWLRSLTARLSPKTVANIHGLVSAIFAEAVTDGHRPGNPSAGQRLPRVTRTDMVILTPQEVDHLAAAGDGLLHDVVITLAYTGLRWGELTGADTSHFDPLADVPVLRVRQTWQRTRTPGGDDAGHVLGPPKSSRAVRDVSVPQRALDVLLPRAVGRDGPLFTGSRGARLDNRSFHRDRWQPAVADLGKRPRLHDLRHTYASWLLSKGIPITDVSRALGHESITTTVDRYGHLTSDHAARVVAALDGLRLTPAETSARTGSAPQRRPG